MGNRFSWLTDRFKNAPSGMKVLWRPMLFASVGLHGLLLVVPMGSNGQNKPEKPKEEPVKLAKLEKKAAPLKKSKPLSQKPKPVTKPKSAITQRTATSLPPALVVKQKPEEKPKEPIPEEKKVTPKEERNNTSPPPPLESNTASSGNLGDGKTLKGDDADIAANMASLRDQVLDNPGEKDTIPKDVKDLAQEFPGDFVQDFFADPNKGLVISKKLLSIEYISRKTPDETYALLSSLYQPPEYVLASTSRGDYGGGPVYELKKGNTTRYINLVPGNFNSYTLVVLWEAPPN
jgi:hypothetical protein